jgi:hypothetical protein
MAVNVPAESRAALALSERRLFRFDSLALEVIEECVRALESEGLDTRRLRFIGDLVHLSAAEFSLIPSISTPNENLLPLSEPLLVEDWAARLAILKTDCSPDWGCYEESVNEGTLPLWDLTLFSSDVSKMVAEEQESGRMTELDLYRHVRTIESKCVESHVPIASAFGRSGVMRVQGLIWRLKLGLAKQENLVEVAGRYLEEFTLTSH